MKQTIRGNWSTGILTAWLVMAGAFPAMAQISGQIYNASLWDETLAAPPGDGNGQGQMVLMIQTTAGFVLGSSVVTNGALPLPAGPYSFSIAGTFVDGTYSVIAYIDGNEDSMLDPGEPYGFASVAVSSNSASKVRITIVDDNDQDGLPDWWEYHWFQNASDPFAYGANDDPDGDGLTNLEEYQLSAAGYGFDYLNPANWDSDGDGMDDGWECKYFNTDLLLGLNPVSIDLTLDIDGDGLSNWQEYCGVDGKPRMVLGQIGNGVRKGKMNSSDDLNPLDVDTDFDLLLDSFETAWYDTANGIDPLAGTGSGGLTNTVTMDTSIAMADSDLDGLSNFREQCLLAQLRQSSTNGWIWTWTTRSPFGFYVYQDVHENYHRLCRMVDQGGAALDLSLAPALSAHVYANRLMLRDHEWTDPTDGSGYLDDPEGLNSGHDTDGDDLPDGWEVQFGLDPRDDGMDGSWINGPFGDPDGDGLMNIEEYYGQDGDRSVTRKYINGTGDETNPNKYDWRPDSTYEWRWYNASDPASGMGDPRVGSGVSRNDTLGSALPTTSLGQDSGLDSDDDGIPDAEEIMPTSSQLASSPVDSCDPFIPRAALITSSNGIPIPDPEPSPAEGMRPAGTRADMQRRDWTLECMVKLLGTNLSGDLFNFQTALGPKGCIVYRLSLSNNAPVLVSDNSAFKHVTITANALPTNQWVHLAAVWDHANNALSLYIDGVLALSPQPLGESFSRYIFPATNRLALAVSSDGSFVNRLMIDEVRIWGLARTEQQISDYSRELVPQVNGDDVWIHEGEIDTVIVNGGGIFEREPGVPLEKVYGKNGSYWIDDGDGQYDAAKDVLLKQGTNLVAGLTGSLVANVFWNDKDNSGDYSRNALLAYYRFDDGGSTVEDYARKAKNGLMGAVCEEYRFGDRGYALPTNNFLFITNDPAPVVGVDLWGADDSDHDGMPDAWELIHGLDPWDDGTWGESSPGVKDGPTGARGDFDHDGLVNIYEYWAGTNPRAVDSDGNGILDSQEDRDGDGVVNIAEQLLGSRPDMIDTDDDGFSDNEEQAMGTSPVNPVDPAISRAVVLGGSPVDYLEVPVNMKQRLSSWTIEAWVNPTNTVDGAGILMRRVVENLAGGTQAVNYVMGLETNSAGLRLYAGYVWPPDGKRYILQGGVIPAGRWTHVAASYNRLNATLNLYTNGSLAATTNSFYIEPPVSGRGGQTFVRMGEDFGGTLDEVRLWSTVRTESQIRANTNKVISTTDTNGLVHYFRFDDGQANTNLFPWGEFHKPGGYQDFTYDRDWNEQWRHAAVAHGAIQSIIPGAIIPPPSLRVILQPDEVVLGGAQWSVDGSGWLNSSDSAQGLTPGAHTVMYKSVMGWSKPSTETVYLTNGVARTITRTYVQQASLVVRFDDLTTPADAAWRVNGGAWMQSGVVVSNLTAGTNILSYFAVPGWFEPPIESVVLSPGTTTELLREYTIMTSAVSVIIIPTNAVAAGARWRVDGGGWLTSGEQSGGLSLSAHLVEFSSLSRWITPANITINPTNELTVVVTGRYSQVTGLAVDISPPDAVVTGAQWRISGGAWTNSGVMLEVPAGTYTVQFKTIGGNWLSPADLTAVVLSEQVTELDGTYFKADIFGGNISTNLGDFWWPYGVTLDAQHRLYVSDTWNDRIQMYDPVSQAWSLVAPKGTNVGQFRKPFGLTVDSKGNLYVADQNNNRVQKRVASNNVWVIVGSNSLGSALGQFNQPADVAVDSSLNLYVADVYNDRVQRLTTSGVWSVFVTNGITAGRVYRPQGVMVDASDAIYVTDSGSDSNSLSRIQKFAKTGQFLGLWGDNQTVNGAMQGPAGMTIGEGHFYVADVLNNRVAVTPTNGVSWTTLVGGSALSGPEDIVWDPRGFLYIADTLNSRILLIPIVPGVETNGLAQLSAFMSTGTNSAFTISWFGRLNWNYAVQYANTMMSSSWFTLPGGTTIPGRDMITNYTDTAVLGITNRFYRVIGY